jgi:uncharacterized membrane protein YfcA
LIDWFVYWFMLPACILIASVAMLTGISGTAMLTPFLILVFPLIRVPVLTPAQAVGMALFTEFFGFASGTLGYHKEGLIDYHTAKKLLLVSVPAIVVFSLIANLVSSLLLRGIYGGMMIALASYLFLSSASSVRNRELRELPEAANRIPRRNEEPTERVISSKRHGEFRYKVCDQKSGLLACGTGAAMEGLVSVGLGELLMPNLVRRCKIPVAVSAATSVFVIAITVLTGSITSVLALVQKGGLGAVPWNLVIYTIPGAVVGGQIGSRFQGAVSSGIMEKFIAALFLVVGLAFVTTVTFAVLS